MSKTVFFLFNLIALFVTTISKYNHQKIFGFSEDVVNPFAQSLLTFIALDRVVTTYRKAKESKDI